MHRFPECTIPASEWSMRFANIHAILDVLDRFNPQLIVEFGSGISTLCVGAWLKRRGHGRVLSFEHDGDWAEVTRRYLRFSHLAEYAEVLDAALTSSERGRSSAWYDIESYRERLSAIDMVIVDGPPAGRAHDGLARLPALPELYDRLSSDAVIFLDDANRPGETEVVKAWVEQFPEFRVRKVGGVTGMAILERCSSECKDMPPAHVSCVAATVC